MIVSPIILTHLLPWCFLAFAAVVAYQVLVGRISTIGLLSSSPQEPTDPERVLLLSLTLVGAFFYVATALNGGLPTGFKLPDAPEWLVAGMGSGNLFYLIGKSLRAK
jgi:hypothetical protein